MDKTERKQLIDKLEKMSLFFPGTDVTVGSIKRRHGSSSCQQTRIPFYLRISRRQMDTLCSSMDTSDRYDHGLVAFTGYYRKNLLCSMSKA